MNLFLIAAVYAMNNKNDDKRNILKNSLQDKYVHGKIFRSLLDHLSSDEDEQQIINDKKIADKSINDKKITDKKSNTK